MIADTEAAITMLDRGVVPRWNVYVSGMGDPAPIFDDLIAENRILNRLDALAVDAAKLLTSKSAPARRLAAAVLEAVSA